MATVAVFLILSYYCVICGWMVFTVAIAQGLVALVAGLAIFPLVFTYGLAPAQGPGLIFVTLPVAFGRMPYGQVFGTALFLTLSFAAITATTVILETVVSVLQEYTRLSRRLFACSSAALIWLAGILTVLSFNRWSTVYPLRFIGIASSKTPFELLDYLTSNIMMPAGGLLPGIVAKKPLAQGAYTNAYEKAFATGMFLEPSVNSKFANCGSGPSAN
jgi:NSS family neurotransmitter:Na+ symporter